MSAGTVTAWATLIYRNTALEHFIQGSSPTGEYAETVRIRLKRWVAGLVQFVHCRFQSPFRFPSRVGTSERYFGHREGLLISVHVRTVRPVTRCHRVHAGRSFCC